MTNFTKAALCSATVLAFVASLPAQQGKSSILQPQMTVGADGGSYSNPAGSMGEKPAETWSATTIGAAVDKKPNAGKVTTVTGEIVDFSCYLQVGKHGDKHKGCAQKCLQNGEPIGLLTSNGTLYMLMAEEHDPRRDGMVGFRKAAVENVAKIMKVTGTESSVNGYHALYVQGYVGK